MIAYSIRNSFSCLVHPVCTIDAKSKKMLQFGSGQFDARICLLYPYPYLISLYLFFLFQVSLDLPLAIMTNENVLGGTALVSPSGGGGSACLTRQQRRSLHSSASNNVDAAANGGPGVAAADCLTEDAVLLEEEEKLMEEDEEITSEEDNNETMERTMLTVGLMKSVVDTTNARTQSSSSLDDSGRSEKFAVDDSSQHRYGLRKRRRPTGQALERLEYLQSSNEGGLARVKQDRPMGSEELPMEGPSADSLTQTPKRAGRKTHLPATQEDPPAPPLICSTSVPNPLQTHLSPVLHNNIKAETNAVAPLATVTVTEVSCPFSVSSSSPTLMPQENSEKKKVTINESMVTSRKRGFSIDIDCKSLAASIAAKVSVVFLICLFPLTVGMDFNDDHANSDVPSVASGRDRAFSFECFAFGINADEPLPPLEHSMASLQGNNTSSNHEFGHVGGRPRGDSIIFDPASFQEGGIHEQNALQKAISGTQPELQAPILSAKPEVVSSIPYEMPTFVSSTNAQEEGEEVDETEDAQKIEASKTTVTTTTTSSAAASLSLELVNKDGRIGIYLPEARRARIARFHAKRSRRIWRKRIKYDCRKKLADSRPRIKGRFVKRSDMED